MMNTDPSGMMMYLGDNGHAYAGKADTSFIDSMYAAYNAQVMAGIGCQDYSGWAQSEEQIAAARASQGTGHSGTAQTSQPQTYAWEKTDADGGYLNVANPVGGAFLAYANDGSLIMGARGPALFPDGFAPAMFAGLGENAAANPSLMPGDLANFNRGGAWDLQRLSGSFDSRFVDSATIVIGIYGAASGIPQKVMLSVENTVAAGATYAPGTVFSSAYPNLPARNVFNTMIGYGLYQNGLVTGH